MATPTFPPISPSVVMATEGRVKLYCFNESLQWNDLGTGRVSLMYLERLQGLAIIIRSEADGKCMHTCVCACVRATCSTLNFVSIFFKIIFFSLYDSEFLIYAHNYYYYYYYFESRTCIWEWEIILHVDPPTILIVVCHLFSNCRFIVTRV